MPKLTTKANKAAKRTPATVPANTAPLGTAAAAQAPRSSVVKPVPAAATAKPATDTAVPAVAKPPAGIARTVRTVLAGRTNFGEISDRDNAYLAFYAGLCRKHGGSVTVSQIHSDGGRPATPGSSNKPHDAGAIVRLSKAGLISFAGDSLALTKLGAERKHA